MSEEDTSGNKPPDRSTLSRLRPRKPVTVLAFVVLLVVAGGLYGVTAAGHYSTFEEANVEGTVVGYHVTEDQYGTVVVVDVAVENPLLRSIEVTTAGLKGYAGGDEVARIGGGFQGVKVPSGETKTLSFRLRPTEGNRQTAIDAVESNELTVTGSVRARISEYQFSFDVYNSTRGATDA